MLRAQMTDHDAFKHLPVNGLVERFIAITQSQYQASLYDEFAKYNKLFREMMAVENELKSRSGDQRTALIPLFCTSESPGPIDGGAIDVSRGAGWGATGFARTLGPKRISASGRRDGHLAEAGARRPKADLRFGAAPRNALLNCCHNAAAGIDDHVALE